MDAPPPPPPIPSLQELCVAYIAKNLHLFPTLAPLPWHLAELVVRTRGNHRVRDADLPLMIGGGHEPPAQVDFLSFRGCAMVSPAGFCSALPHFVALTVIDFSLCEQVQPRARAAPVAATNRSCRSRNAN
jgi:hypothetical protein